LDFTVIDNEFVHPLSSKINVSGTLLQQTEAVKPLLDMCINIIFVLTGFTGVFRSRAAEVEKWQGRIQIMALFTQKKLCKPSI
jgi:hypothetical protein